MQLDNLRNISDIYLQETRERSTLLTEIHQLQRLNQQMNQEAATSAKPSKAAARSKATGGELVLERGSGTIRVAAWP